MLARRLPISRDGSRVMTGVVPSVDAREDLDTRMRCRDPCWRCTAPLLFLFSRSFWSRCCEIFSELTLFGTPPQAIHRWSVCKQPAHLSGIHGCQRDGLLIGLILLEDGSSAVYGGEYFGNEGIAQCFTPYCLRGWRAEGSGSEFSFCDSRLFDGQESGGDMYGVGSIWMQGWWTDFRMVHVQGLPTYLLPTYCTKVGSNTVTGYVRWIKSHPQNRSRDSAGEAWQPPTVVHRPTAPVPPRREPLAFLPFLPFLPFHDALVGAGRVWMSSIRLG